MFISERVNISNRFAKCAEIDAHISKYTMQLGEKLSEIIAVTDAPLDCRISRVRTEETALGNFVTDLIRTECEADIGLTNGGALRANFVFPVGPL